MRWSCVVVLGLAACTALNPEFGLDGDSTGSNDGRESTSSIATSPDSTFEGSGSGETGINNCPEFPDAGPHIKLVGDPLAAGMSTGSISVSDNLVHVDCGTPCAMANPADCIPYTFSIDPPLWNGWIPPVDCYRFQFVGDGEYLEELRIGAGGDERDELLVIATKPLLNATYDVWANRIATCECSGAECCLDETGEYELIVPADAEVHLDAGHDHQDDVSWGTSLFRVEAGGTSIVPDCTSPKRLQFRSYRLQ